MTKNKITITATRYPTKPDLPKIIFKREFWEGVAVDFQKYADDMKRRLYRIAGNGSKLEVNIEKTTI